MLIQFSVENFLSIKDNVVLSLLASKDNEHPEHLIVDGNKKHLKSAVIYGANASGKSNVLNAFWFMVNYVLTSHNQQLHKTIERSPFKFDRETPSRPSSFEVIFTTNGIRYAYGFSVIRTRSVLSSCRSTFDRRMYGASTALIRFGYGADTKKTHHNESMNCIKKRLTVILFMTNK